MDLVISDIKMPDFSGVELLREAKQLSPDTVFIMITAFASTETAIEALQHGAYDYITKPFKMEDLRAVVRRALAKKQVRSRALQRPRVTWKHCRDRSCSRRCSAVHVVGKSPKMVEVYRTIGTVAMGDSTILITGESGTGKELVARAIHEASHRKDKPFVSINCSAFPETLLESELFGYMKGAFTGAAGNKKGLFEAAGGGSIFLDEIGDMTPAMQVKLLRVLQERRLRPLGGTAEVPVDVRVIAATNQDLQSRIQQGLFREDLYYRIAVINIHLPALRERAEDIGLAGDSSFCANMRNERAKALTAYRRKRFAAWSPTAGREMCASWKTPSSGRSRWKQPGKSSWNACPIWSATGPASCRRSVYAARGPLRPGEFPQPDRKQPHSPGAQPDRRQPDAGGAKAQPDQGFPASQAAVAADKALECPNSGSAISLPAVPWASSAHSRLFRHQIMPHLHRTLFIGNQSAA